MPERLSDDFRARPGTKLGQDVREVRATSWAAGSQVGVSAARPAIRGGATVMDSTVEAEDAPGSGSEHGGNAEIAS